MASISRKETPRFFMLSRNCSKSGKAEPACKGSSLQRKRSSTWFRHHVLQRKRNSITWSKHDTLLSCCVLNSCMCWTTVNNKADYMTSVFEGVNTNTSLHYAILHYQCPTSVQMPYQNPTAPGVSCKPCCPLLTHRWHCNTPRAHEATSAVFAAHSLPPTSHSHHQRTACAASLSPYYDSIISLW